MVEGSSRIRKARDLTREEIELCHKRRRGDIEAMAEEFEVSAMGLKRRPFSASPDRVTMPMVTAAVRHELSFRLAGSFDAELLQDFVA